MDRKPAGPDGACRASVLLGLAQCAKVGRKVLGRHEAVGVIVTQYPAATGEGVLGLGGGV